MATQSPVPVEIDTTSKLLQVTQQVANITWSIPNFLAVQRNASLMKEQVFEVATGNTPNDESKWLIGLKTDSDLIGIYLKLLQTDDASLKVSAKITLQMKKGDGSTHWTGNKEATLAATQELFFKHLCPVDREDKYWLPWLDTNGALVFAIQMETYKPSDILQLPSLPSSLTANMQQKYVDKLLKNFGALLTDPETSDVTIVCSGKEILAHKYVLAGQSSVFQSMLGPKSGYSESKNGIIEVKDVTGKTMEILLRYFYTGELLSNWSDKDTILEFTYAAGKYLLEDVLEMLDENLGKCVDSSCCIQLASLANKLGLKKAESELVKKIAEMTTAAKSFDELVKIYKDLNTNGESHCDK